MANKAKVIRMDSANLIHEDGVTLRLGSGKQVRVQSNDHQEQVEITDARGEPVVQICLNTNEPTLLVKGARLILRSSERLSLISRKVHIKAQEAATIESDGALDIKSTKATTLSADDDVRVTGKTIHLN